MVAGGKINLGQDWRTADRSPTGIAPDPDTTREAVVQVYAARALNWRGIFAVHTSTFLRPAIKLPGVGRLGLSKPIPVEDGYCEGRIPVRDTKLNSDLGLMTALTLVFALIIHFLLLPPLLMYIDKGQPPTAGRVATSQRGGQDTSVKYLV